MFNYWALGHCAGFKISPHQPCLDRASSLERDIMLSWPSLYIWKCKFPNGGNRCCNACGFKSWMLCKAALLIFFPHASCPGTRLWETSGNRRCYRHSLLPWWEESCLSFSISHPFPQISRLFPWVIWTTKIYTIQYFIFLIASPNSLQGPWLCLPPASCAHVYSRTHRLMNRVSGCAPGIPSCTGRCSTSDNNADNTNTSKHDDRTYCIPGKVPGTIHKATDLASMTAPWDTYEFFSSFADENTERLGSFSKVTQLVRCRLRLKPWQSGSRVHTLKHHTLLPLYLLTW